MILPENWQTKSLRDVCDITSSKRIYRSEYVENGIPFFRGKEIIQKASNENISTSLYISKKKYHEIEQKYGVPKSGDILLTSVGTLGIPYIVKSNDIFYFKDGNLTWFKNFHGIDNKFLYYWLLSPQMKEKIFSSHIGVAQPALTIVGLQGFQINLPPLPTQRKIAAILCAYDDLIENNTRRIQILEEMAQDIYREWFVHFRFPGHEDVRMVDSGTELGEVPEGWKVIKLSELVKTQYGYTESTRKVPIGPKYLRGMDINKTSFINWSEVPYCSINGENYAKYKLNIGDIVIIRMADPGKVGIVEKEVNAVFASYLIRLLITSEKLTSYYLFYTLISDHYQGYITGASTGTTRKSASAPVIVDYNMVIPSQKFLLEFENFITSIRLMMNKLLDMNAKLRMTRDLLLPKLISGEVNVSELDFQI